MPKRESSKIVVVDGRKWKIGKFDALTGGYIAVKLTSRMVNVVAGIVSGELKTTSDSDKAIMALQLAQEIGSLSKRDFFEIQSECLHVIKEIETVNEIEVETVIRRADGAWGVRDIEDNASLVMALVVHVLVFNLTNFFDVSKLKELKESFGDLNLSDAQTSTNSSTPQS